MLNTISAEEIVQTDHTQIQLISEVTSISPGVPFHLGVRFTLDHLWHIYWQNPGDAGLQPEFSWQMPNGFTAGDIQWPYPERIMVGGLANFGYENEVLFIVKIQPASEISDAQITIGLEAEWLVCKEECIPGEAGLEITLPVSDNPSLPDERWIKLFSDTRAQHPLTDTDWQVAATIKDTLLVLTIKSPEWYHPNFERIEFFPVQEEIIANAAEQILSVSDKVYTLEVPLNAMRPADPDTIHGVLVAEEGWRGENSEKALAFSATVESYEAQSQDPSFNIGLALLFAFLGGIILNIMPCVLPVLSLKVLSFVKQAGEDRAKVFLHGLIFTAGVVLSFLILAALLIILRASGEQLGWGFQLQSPEFIMVLSVFLFLFGLNLFGVFEIGTSIMGTGQNLAGRGGWFGSFMSGVTATIVATPCTAPFMGSALGFAVTQTSSISLSIFFMLGLGMAFPYLLISMVPGLLKFVPKPGPWMETLKQFMGFLLVATVIWLIWVFGIQTGIDSIVILLTVLLLTALAAWVIGRWTQLNLPKIRRITARVIAFVILFAALGWGINSISVATGDAAMVRQTTGINWEKYSKDRLESALAAGFPVFIDFTAAWCLSCQVNERVAFSSEDVQQAFSEQNFVMLKADWTNRDEEITRALAGYGRNSVPLYVIHNDPDVSKNIILPEIISPDIVLDYLNQLKKL